MRSAWKLSVLTVCLLAFVTGCLSLSGIKAASEPAPQQEVVERLLQWMIDSEDEDIKSIISPQWVKENRVKLEKYRINAYGPQDYKITRVQKTKVVAEIFFVGGTAHELTFTVRKEGGRYYIVPGERSEGWIDPWTDVRLNVR